MVDNIKSILCKIFLRKSKCYLRISQVIFNVFSNCLRISHFIMLKHVLSLRKMKIVENIKEIRLKKGITQEVLADCLSVDGSVISNIEKGKRELKVSELEKIAKCLNEDVLYLFTYPKRYIEQESVNTCTEDKKVSITFEVTPAMQESLLKLVLKE